MEIVAPAGDKEAFFSAVANGANAVYLGLDAFSARANAGNFVLEELCEVLKYARLFGVRVYVALNTLIKDSEMSQFFQCVKNCYELGVDAFILQDVFLGKTIKEMCPKCELHLSTQAGTNNIYGALTAKENCFDRVIVARETRLKEIAEICKIIDVECFVQGALCTAFSGQCYLSSFIGNNSGNRGRCKQPCRKKYSIGDTEYYYSISLADLSVGEQISKFKEIGVGSIKIEGRMRRREYVAASVKYYRDIIENRKADSSILKRTYNRGNYTSGLAFGQKDGLISKNIQNHIGEKIGQVKQVDKNFAEVSSKHPSVKGDAFKIIRGGLEVGNGIFNAVHKSGFLLSYSGKIQKDDEVYITTDIKLNEALNAKKLAVSVEIALHFSPNMNACATIKINSIKYEVFSDSIFPSAEKHSLTNEEVEACFNKTDDMPFRCDKIQITRSGDVFAAKSALNAFRRKVFSEAFDKATYIQKRKVAFLPPDTTIYKSSLPINKTVSIISNDFSELNLTSGNLIFSPNDYSALQQFKKFFSDTKDFQGKKYLYVPSFMNAADEIIICETIESFDGIYCEGVWGEAFAKKLNKQLFYGTDANIFNSLDLIKLNSIENVALSKELSLSELKGLHKENTHIFCGGNVKVMNLVYCIFSKKCETCQKKVFYFLKDEEGRVLPLRRVRLSECRFEVYNPNIMYSDFEGNKLYNFIGIEKETQQLFLSKNLDKIKQNTKEVTGGHFFRPVI